MARVFAEITDKKMAGPSQIAFSFMSFITELFCQPDEKPFGSADVAEPIRVMLSRNQALYMVYSH
jgi:hypothetical protein